MIREEGGDISRAAGQPVRQQQAGHRDHHDHRHERHTHSPAADIIHGEGRTGIQDTLSKDGAIGQDGPSLYPGDYGVHDSVAQEWRGLQVIGAGFGRTGTQSFSRAMAMLGFPTYNMVEQFRRDHSSFWIEKLEGPSWSQQQSSFDDVFREGSYVASIDFPSSLFWKEQLLEYPDALVVLTYRDPENWYASCCETIFLLGNSPYSNLGIKIGMALLNSKGQKMFHKMFAAALGKSWAKEDVINR
jgi:Sulfotransferase domain